MYKRQVLVLENTFESSPNILLELTDSVESDSLGLCLDVAHAVVYSTLGLGSWWDAFEPRLRELHLNDTDGFSDEHLSLGKGNINFREVFGRAAGLKQDAVLVLEMPAAAALESLSTIEREGYQETQLELL